MVAHDTRIVIGHSLGSIAAYEALCQLPTSPVRLLITLGSPLGIRPHVFDRLESMLMAGRRAWPNGLTRWISLYDARDVVAFRQLTPLFGNGHQIIERAVANGIRPHRAESYLANGILSLEVGLAVQRWATPDAGSSHAPSLPRQ
jgi:pimeloyl-ACP methyl ester carboxylesterase